MRFTKLCRIICNSAIPIIFSDLTDIRTEIIQNLNQGLGGNFTHGSVV